MTKILSRRMLQRPFRTSAIDGRRGNRSDGTPARAGSVAALGRTQLGGTGTRIACDFIVVSRDYGSFGEHTEGRRRAIDFRCMTRTTAGLAAIGEKSFDDAVLERVK